MGDVDDAPDQAPLQENALFDAILNIVPPDRFELVITHSPKGEYTRHRRHEETGAAVIKLWRCRKLSCGQLWTFAYDDSEGRHLPRASSEADVVTELSEELWQTKRRIITDIYGFAHTSFEARTTPRTEAFRCFESPADAMLTL
jgi:LmbE family N-acetylglucosaminyl deacetylase